jgi:hypothetical protein
MQIVTSKYRHPEIKSGQHTNGPESIFVRENDSSPWYLVLDHRCKHSVRKKIERIGIEEFLATCCGKLDD